MRPCKAIFLLILSLYLTACFKPSVHRSIVAEGFKGPVDNVLIVYNAWAFGENVQYIKKDRLQELAKPFINNNIRANVLYINNYNNNMLLQQEKIAEDYDYMLLITPEYIYNAELSSEVIYALYLTSVQSGERLWVATVRVSSGYIKSSHEQYMEIGEAALQRMYEDGVVDEKPIFNTKNN